MTAAGRLFVISAPTGTGKTTLVERLVRETPGLEFSVSYTTRAPRPGERAGRDYHFVDRERFLAMVEQGLFMESAEVYGELYGTSLEAVEGARDKGIDVVLDIDAQGAEAVSRAEPAAVLVLVLPPSWQALRQRLAHRGTDDPQAIERRLRAVRRQLEAFPLYRYAVVNDDVERAYGALRAIVEAERNVLERSRELLEELLREAR